MRIDLIIRKLSSFVKHGLNSKKIFLMQHINMIIQNFLINCHLVLNLMYLNYQKLISQMSLCINLMTILE